MKNREIEIGIVSFRNDVHALAVKKAFEEQYQLACHIIETDSMSGTSSLSWSNGDTYHEPASFQNSVGNRVYVSNFCTIWWRRFFEQRQNILPYVTNLNHIDLIKNDCNASILGIFLTSFSGAWISNPTATRLANNKLIQLKAAQSVGFQVPKTLISQNPEAIRDFCKILNYQVIVKPVRGTLEIPLFTKKITEAHLSSDESLCLCPAIYQEYIPGDKHIRVHCFGKNVYSVLIETEELDWRQNLDIPFSVIELEQDVKQHLIQVLEILDLKMGVFDLKLNQDGKPIWLEVNPQGQFLFSEGLSGLDLTSAFIEFLYQEATQAFKKKFSG
jgi:hypothetical protein